MSDASDTGILYTEYAALAATSPVASLWSYGSRARERDRRSVARTADGSHEYWLDRSDPLLNTILPGTGVSLVLNFGDLWSAGRSLVTSALLPRACVVGPVTQPRILRVGRSVHAIGAVVSPTLTPRLFGAPASALVDRIVALEDLWDRGDVDRVRASLSCLDRRPAAAALKTELVARLDDANHPDGIARTAPRLITLHGGRVSIDALAARHGVSRQQFAQRFSAATGLRPKQFARIARFQSLVQALLSTDVSQWAAVASSVGFYDQAHMINEFRAFTGSPPTIFFQPHGLGADRAAAQLRGRPSEW